MAIMSPIPTSTAPVMDASAMSFLETQAYTVTDVITETAELERVITRTVMIDVITTVTEAAPLKETSLSTKLSSRAIGGVVAGSLIGLILVILVIHISLRWYVSNLTQRRSQKASQQQEDISTEGGSN